MLQVVAAAAMVQVEPDAAPFRNRATVNVSPAGTAAPNVRPADVSTPPGAATVVTLHVVADVLAHADESDTYSVFPFQVVLGAEPESLVVGPPNAVLGAEPASLVFAGAKAVLGAEPAKFEFAGAK